MKWPPLLFTVYIYYILSPDVQLVVYSVFIYICQERGFKCIVLPTHIFSLHDIKKVLQLLFA
jgi:hypothetical protein